MTNRSKLLCLTALTAIMAFTNGCFVAGDSHPVFDKKAYQEDQEARKIEWCLDHPDAWGCPGLPCVDSLCVAGECRDMNDESTGLCCMPGDKDCNSLVDRDGSTMVDSLRDNPDDCDHDPCADPDVYHIGCPGYPCAHGSCFEGVCVGRTTDEDGYQIDPGVCCLDDDC